MKKPLVLLLLALAVCVAVAAVMLRSGTAELTLYCGAGISPAADALIAAFSAQSGIRVSPTYNGSGLLLGQITANQKGDLFMPGADFYVDKATTLGLAAEDTKRVIGYFVPVIFVQKGNRHKIASLKDLTRPGLRLGIGDERACAVGQQTLRILEKNAIPYADIQKNVVCKTGTVNELGMAIQLRTVDAVITWDTNARDCAKDGEIIPIPDQQNVISPISIVLLKSSRHPAESRRFIEFVTSDRGKQILTAKGYRVQPPGK